MRGVKCSGCGRTVEFWAVVGGQCSICRARSDKIEEDAEAKTLKDRQEAMILTTEAATSMRISERLGIVGSQCALGMSLFKDIFVGGRDLWGGRSDTLQQQIAEGRATVLAEISAQAATLNADAVISIQFTFSEFSGGGSRMLFIAATGTAVRIAEG